MADKNYYDILGVDKSASKEEIKKAYKKMAKKYHPDISKEDGAEQKFKEVNEAAGVLLDDQKKQNYDNYGSADGPQGFGGFGGGSSSGFNPGDFGINLDDIFEQFGFGGSQGFGGFGGGSSSRSRRQKDNNIYTEVEINLDDVYFGVEKEFSITREDKCDGCDGNRTKNKHDIKTCDECNGTGSVESIQRSFLGNIRTKRTCDKCGGTGETIKNPCDECMGSGTSRKKDKITVKIPKGVEPGVTLRVNSKGNYDPISKNYADLFVKVYIRNNTEFDVDGQDLYKEIEINFIQAILGDEIEFEHFDKTLSVKIPAGTQSNSTLRIKNKGLPYFNYDGFGDLYIKVKVKIPTKTSKEQKKILHEYAKTLKDKSFLSRLKNLFN